MSVPAAGAAASAVCSNCNTRAGELKKQRSLLQASRRALMTGSANDEERISALELEMEQLEVSLAALPQQCLTIHQSLDSLFARVLPPALAHSDHMVQSSRTTLRACSQLLQPHAAQSSTPGKQLLMYVEAALKACGNSSAAVGDAQADAAGEQLVIEASTMQLMSGYIQMSLRLLIKYWDRARRDGVDRGAVKVSDTYRVAKVVTRCIGSLHHAIRPSSQITTLDYRASPPTLTPTDKYTWQDHVLVPAQTLLKALQTLSTDTALYDPAKLAAFLSTSDLVQDFSGTFSSAHTISAGASAHRGDLCTIQFDDTLLPDDLTWELLRRQIQTSHREMIRHGVKTAEKVQQARLIVEQLLDVLMESALIHGHDVNAVLKKQQKQQTLATRLKELQQYHNNDANVRRLYKWEDFFTFMDLIHLTNAATHLHSPLVAFKNIDFTRSEKSYSLWATPSNVWHVAHPNLHTEEAWSNEHDALAVSMLCALLRAEL